MNITLTSVLLFLLGSFLSAQELDFLDPISENKQLNEDGFVITETTHKQGFSVYIGNGRPRFITSDSLLMAYNDLLERSIADKQVLALGNQRELISKLVKKLPAPAPDNNATTAVRLVVGTAHRILFGKIATGFTDAEKKLIEQEASKVESHQGSQAPSWWVKESYIPYSRFAVPSPWDKNDILKQYYRYTQWMMSMPFDRADPHHQGIEKTLRIAIENTYSSFRNEDDIGLIQAIMNRRNQHEASALIQYKSSPDKALLDQVLQKDQSLKNLTANLAASFDNKILPANSKHKQQIDALREIDQPLFKALRALNQPADKQAPKIFSSEAWQRKQLNCTLGAWAEYRHAIGITQTSSAYWLSATTEPAGFIEPVPEFFQALGIASEDLARQSTEIQKTKYEHRLLLFALLLDEARSYYQTEDPFGGSQYSFIESIALPLEAYKGIDDPKSLKMLTDKLEQVTQDYWNGNTEELEAFYEENKNYLETDTITPRLQQLAILCYRLEAMSRKQLAKNPWSTVEEEFITNYGKELAHLMHYYGNSYFDPRDDAPSIIQIAHLGSPSSESILHCGNARPREILINYPDRNGNPVLCQGAVYNYREVISDKPITDKTWIESCKKSSPPTWLAPIIIK